MSNIQRRIEYSDNNIIKYLHYLSVFNLYFSKTEEHMFFELFSTLDFADQIADLEIVENSSEHIIDYLAGNAGTLHKDIPDHVAHSFGFVRNLMKEMGVSKRIEIYMRDILLYRKDRSCAVSTKTYLHASIREALSYSKILLTFMPSRAGKDTFNRFIMSGCIAIRFVDDMVDMKEDYANGNLIRKPSVQTRVVLRGIVFILLWKVCRYYPRKWFILKAAWNLFFQQENKPAPILKTSS